MAYDDQDGGNEFANGAGNRFEGCAEMYKAGGRPRAINEDQQAAYLALREFLAANKEGPLAGLSADLPTLELVREMKALKDAREAVETLAKEINRRWDYMRLSLIPERFEADGLKNAKLEGVGRVSLRGDIYASIRPGQKEAAFTWLDDNGRGDLIQRTVNASSLKASMKKMLEAGEEEIPDELFRVEPFTMATITKA